MTLRIDTLIYRVLQYSIFPVSLYDEVRTEVGVIADMLMEYVVPLILSSERGWHSRELPSIYL
jgi:hypothetical protein